MQVRKQFSRSLYEAYDTPAKEALVAILETKGHTLVNTEEDYYADVVSTKGGYTYFNEAEVKVGWKGEWPPDWTEIRIPERKKRLLKKYEGVNGVLNFYVFSKDLSQAWRIKDTQLTEGSLKEAKGGYIQKGEKFFHIPYNQAELVKV